MKKTIALGSPEKFVKLGDFNIVSKNGRTDVYYNMDLGNNDLYDVDSNTYKNLNKIHQSFHHSGEGHMKEQSKGPKIIVGHTSDSSILNCQSMDPLVLGVESFLFDISASSGIPKQGTLFLDPPEKATQFSVLWLWVPTDHPQKIHPRCFYVNLFNFDRQFGYYMFQTASLANLAITSETQTILSMNGWELRAIFLKTLLPVMNQNVILPHPKGRDRPLRAWVCLNAHLPLSLKWYKTKLKRKNLC